MNNMTNQHQTLGQEQRFLTKEKTWENQRKQKT